jgi:hypothetical protein
MIHYTRPSLRTESGSGMTWKIGSVSKSIPRPKHSFKENVTRNVKFMKDYNIRSVPVPELMVLKNLERLFAVKFKRTFVQLHIMRYTFEFA